MFRFMVSKKKDQTIFYQRYLSKGIHFLADLVQILCAGTSLSKVRSLLHGLRNERP